MFPRASLYAFPAAILAWAMVFVREQVTALEDFLQLDTFGFDRTQVWAAMTATLLFLVSFRTRTAFARFWEGTSLLHQMRGEWFDSVSCLLTFSRAMKYEEADKVANFRHTLVRLTSLMHGSAMEEIQTNLCDDYERFRCIDVEGLDLHSVNWLRKCEGQYKFCRVEVILHMIQVLVTQSLVDGILQIPAPILSRVYQTLSRGLVNLLNARKISDTAFPFMYVQVINALLLSQVMFAPVVMATLVEQASVAAVLTFFPVFGVYALNIAAAELEMPFGDDYNDLPLRNFQEEMNSCLLMLLHDEADHLAYTTRDDFDKWDDLWDQHTSVVKGRQPRSRKRVSIFGGVGKDDDSEVSWVVSLGRSMSRTVSIAGSSYAPVRSLSKHVTKLLTIALASSAPEKHEKEPSAPGPAPQTQEQLDRVGSDSQLSDHSAITEDTIPGSGEESSPLAPAASGMTEMMGKRQSVAACPSATVARHAVRLQPQNVPMIRQDDHMAIARAVVSASADGYGTGSRAEVASATAASMAAQVTVQSAIVPLREEIQALVEELQGLTLLFRDMVIASSFISSGSPEQRSMASMRKARTSDEMYASEILKRSMMGDNASEKSEEEDALPSEVLPTSMPWDSDQSSSSSRVQRETVLPKSVFSRKLAQVPRPHGRRVGGPVQAAVRISTRPISAA